MIFIIEVRHVDGWGHLTRAASAWAARVEVDYLTSIGLTVRAVDPKGMVVFQTEDDDLADDPQPETDPSIDGSVAH